MNWHQEREALAAEWFAEAAKGIAETFVYRYFDADDQLLYVGQSAHPDSRERNHRNRSPWFVDVARRELAGPFTKDIALAVEFFAIRQELPIHNGARGNGYRGPYSLAWHQAESAEYGRRAKADPDFVRANFIDAFDVFAGRAS